MAAQDAGVVDLLRRLQSHICCEAPNEFKHILAIYERLLNFHKDTNVSAQRGLLDIRAKLLSCGQDANAVNRMDRTIEHCINLGQQHTVVDDVIHLLVALAGGYDGDTFDREDAKLLTSKESSLSLTDEKTRPGDCIQMRNIDMVQRSRAIFLKAPISLQEKSLYSRSIFSNIGNGIPGQHTGLWCPCTDARDDRVLPNRVQNKQPSLFFSLPDKGSDQQSSDDEFTTSYVHRDAFSQHKFMDLEYFGGRNTTQIQPHGQGYMNYLSLHFTLGAEKQSNRLSTRKLLSPLGSSQNVNCESQAQQEKWGVASSITEESSWELESSCDCAETWVAQTYAWEDLGDRAGLPENHAKPSAWENNWSLRDQEISDSFACNRDPLFEICEADLIESSLLALNGVESTVFRRNIQAAEFELPRRLRLKLPFTTVSSTMSVLEVFRISGTMIMRLELLALFYSQDPSRGGKTLQAMGDALQLYLSVHRTLVETISRQCLETLSSENNQENHIISVTKVLYKTRGVCRVAKNVGVTFCCDVDDFWSLLQKGKFPRGIALLNRLHHYVSTLRVDDSSGRNHALVTWFLVKCCSPLLEMLSSLILTGKVDEKTDLLNEFDATTWSANMLTMTVTGGGDELFSDNFSDKVTEMLPKFLSNISSVIAHLSQILALLRGVNAPISTRYLAPLKLHLRGDQAIKLVEKWKSKMERMDDVAFTEEMYHLDNKDTYGKVSGETFAAVGESEQDVLRVNHEAGRESKLQSLELEGKKHQFEVTQQGVDDIKQINEIGKALADRQANGSEAILTEHFALIVGVEERHDYMRWRRDRALRLSTAREQLQCLRGKDLTEWLIESRRKKSTLNPVDGMADCVPNEKILKRTTVMTGKTSRKSDSEIKQKVFKEVDSDAATCISFETRARDRRSYIKAKDSNKAINHAENWRNSVKLLEKTSDSSSNEDIAFIDRESYRKGVPHLYTSKGNGAAIYCNLNDLLHGESTLAENGGLFPALLIDRKDPTRDKRIFRSKSSNRSKELTSDIGTQMSAASQILENTRLPLSSVHPFFSTLLTEEDIGLLTQALTDTASKVELNSFASVVDCCIENPVRFLAEKFEQVALDCFRHPLQILEHLCWLRKLMLMSEGLCMDIFARDLLVGTRSNTRAKWGIKGCLSSVLNMALIEASVKQDGIVQAFHYETTSALSQMLNTLAMIPTVSKILNEIELLYDVKWPLGFVINTQTLDQYKQMHRFLLHVRLISLEFREVWTMLRTFRRQGSLSSSLDRLCGGTVFKIQMFLRAYNETFATQVLMVAWTELELEVKQATKLVEIRHCHEKYVVFAITCCFLDEHAFDIHLAFLDLLTAAWSLTEFLRALGRHVTGTSRQEAHLGILCDKSNAALRVMIEKLHHCNQTAERNTRRFSEVCESYGQFLYFWAPVGLSHESNNSERHAYVLTPVPRLYVMCCVA
ncbi:putative gamma-tubulin complex component protein [Plasmopara halstedii]